MENRSLDADSILDAWSTDPALTTRMIAIIMEAHNGTICNIILRARDRGDPRAVQRRPSQGYYHREARKEAKHVSD